MNNRLLILLCLLVTVNSSCKKGKKNQITTKIENTIDIPNATVAEVEIAVRNFYEAVVDPTSENLDKVCADGLTYGHSIGVIQDKDQFIDDLLNGPYDFTSVNTEGQTINLSGDIAVVRHNFVAEALHEGEPTNIRLGCLQIYQLSAEGIWKLLARQGYKL